MLCPRRLLPDPIAGHLVHRADQRRIRCKSAHQSVPPTGRSKHEHKHSNCTTTTTTHYTTPTTTHNHTLRATTHYNTLRTTSNHDTLRSTTHNDTLRTTNHTLRAAIDHDPVFPAANHNAPILSR